MSDTEKPFQRLARLTDEDPVNYGRGKSVSIRRCKVNPSYDELFEANEIMREAIKEAHDFLNTDIAMLPCESRQRDLPEDVWSEAMYQRDVLEKALQKVDEIMGKE